MSKMETETKFIYNLTKLANNANAVDIETMISIIRYTKTHSVTETKFIQDIYFDIVSENADTQEIFTENFEKEKQTTTTLEFYRKTHQKALAVFSESPVKTQILQAIQERKLNAEKNAVESAVLHMIHVAENYPTNPVSSVFSEIVKQYVAENTYTPVCRENNIDIIQ
jgi:hypothetical protein